MRRNNNLILLTLASNGKPTIVPKDNIAFAVEMDAENDQKQIETFTRIFLKQADLEDGCNWVDVKESVQAILF